MKSAEEFYAEGGWNTDAAAIKDIKARDLEMWKKGMTDAAGCVRNNPRYAGEHWLPEGIESKRDQTKSV